ncbi:MAG: hypothetical protein BGO49_11145 [Planctomycetales bacterium 71-10]|nr:MAG: hypothetical protein BGO49_11145 [Planctomycetales bacterium 71-10]
MPATCRSAFDTILSVDKTGGTTTYTEISLVLNIDGPSREVGSVETTHLRSPRKTYRPGLPDGGEMSFEIEYDPADAEHIFLAGLADEPEVLSWRITYPLTPAKHHTFQGFLTAFEPSAGGPEENLTASVTVKVTGAVVETTAS